MRQRNGDAEGGGTARGRVGRAPRRRRVGGVDRLEARAMEIMRYGETASFPFGHLVVRDMTPTGFRHGTLAEVEVPIGADNPPYAAAANDKIYVGITGEIEFSIDGEAVRVKRGDVLLIEAGEQFSYHNGGYEMGRLFLIQIPHGAG